MEQNKEYFVFISYSSLDNEWAIWLRHELEHYHLPASFNGRTDVRDNLRKVFRDRDELSAGPEWDEQVQKTLENTNNLIVICSPHSAKSPAVNKEVETFIALGKEDHIFPFIVEGDKPEDCFPPALRHSKLGGDVNKDGGRDSAFIKVVAGMLKVSFPSLWDRYEIEKAEEERKIREQRDKLRKVQSRFLAEKAITLADEGDSYTARLLMMEAVATPSNPEYPYTVEAEKALRYINDRDSAILRGHTMSVNSAMFSHDGKLIVSASWDGTIRIWDVKNGNCIRTLKGHEDSVSYASFNPNDKLIASASWDKTIKLWDVETGECLLVFEGHTANVNSVEFSHDGKYLVSASGVNNDHCQTDTDKDSIMVWDILKKQRIFTLTGYKGSVRYAQFSDDDSIIASASDDGTICFWNTREGTKLSTLKGHKTTVEHLDFILGREEIISSGYGDIYIWNTNTGELVRTIPTEGQAHQVICHPRKNLIAAIMNQSIHIWDASTGELLKKIATHLPSIDDSRSICFSPDGKHIVLAASDNTVRILDVFSSKWVEFEGHNDVVLATCFSPDGKTLISSSDYFEKAICVWDAKTAEKRCKLLGHKGRIKSLAMLSDNKTIVSASHDGTIRFWDKDGTEKSLINLANGGINSISLSPDEKYMACAQDGKISLWDVNTGKCIWVSEGSIYDNSNSVSYSPNGELIAAAWGNSVLLLQADDGTPIRIINRHDDFIFSVDFSHDGTRIVSASRDKAAKVWDVESGECVLVLEHTADVSSAKFGPDDNFIASTSFDGFIRTWNTIDGSPIYVLNTHCFSSTSISISPTGEQLAVSTSNKLLLLNYPKFEKIIDDIQSQFSNRQLSSKERKRYYLD